MLSNAKTLALATMMLAAVSAAEAQLGQLNLLTDLATPFPPGCLSIEIPDQPRPGQDVLVTEIGVPSVNSEVIDAAVEVTTWRVACADDGFSVVLVRLAQTGGADPVLVPQVFVETGEFPAPNLPRFAAQLVTIPVGASMGATGGLVSEAGQTWMLTVDPRPLTVDTTFSVANYNDLFTLELNWETFAETTPDSFQFVIDPFDSEVERPQFDQPVLNGRFTGQWVVPDSERQGLMLQIGEQLETNFVFATFFTYLDGEPIWLAGNTEPDIAEPGPVTLELAAFEQGGFITAPDQPPSDAIDSEPAGEITLEVIDCNTLNMQFDFTPLGQNSGSVELRRLIRTGGYDCNPWTPTDLE